ncbi:MAG: protein translocase subunit SecD [Alicyclobacillus herbarius]|uniref:protein translocase subunit SecD n=1 Tax=Alicyclobacillus herbarius TaxID=122960 RepID=UPI0003FBF0F9|nr:protein translocase subunit SecD [Alicyclobacillus herbarius]MCL6632824.1 protein translocase subunit SecD [Alicyclobacillus herbarius]
MRWGRFLGFLAIVCMVLGVTAGTSMNIWKTIRLGLDLQGGMDLLYKIEPPQGKPLTEAGKQALLQAVQLRVNSLGVASPVIELESGNQIRVELAGNFNQQTAERVIGQTAQLEIYGSAVQKNGKWVPDPKAKPLITGADMQPNSAHEAQDEYGNIVVDLTFKNKQKWADITKQYTNKTLYTFLNGQLLTAARVDGEIPNGQTQLSGNFTVQSATELAKELNAGALPYPLKLISSMNVGPTLGMVSLKATLWAGLAAVALIFLFMIIVYRLAGVVADLALVAYGYLTLVTFSGMHVVLTLSGLAALVLGMGMAVDANIITYERVKDEVRAGKSLQSAVIAGNKRALRTIVDANATTFIAGAVMYWFGQGDIRGFAVALMISIIISMLTAVLLSRAMLLLLTRSGVVHRPWWYGAPRGVVKP